MNGLGRQPRISTVPFRDFATCMTIAGPLMFRILPSGKLDVHIKVLRPRSIRRE